MDALIIRPGALGDTLMLVPALVDLRKKAKITFVGRKPGLDFARDHVFREIDMEGSGWHRLFMERPDNKGLPISHMDIVVAFFSDEDRRVHHNLKSYLPNARVHVFPSLPPEGEKVHVARYLAECLMSGGLPVNPQKAIETTTKGALFKTVGPPRLRDKIVLHPGSGARQKNYPPDLWISVLGRLFQLPALENKDAVVLLGPAEESLRAFFREHEHSINAQIQDCPDKELLVKILRKAILYLGHDSGITHLAAMLGTPTVALFKKTDPHQWHPLGPFVTLIQNKKVGHELIEEVLSMCSQSLLSCLEEKDLL